MNKYTFSGHESFSCKSLWLKKGYDFVVNGRNFNAPHSVIDLGVGKNMVASIRYWLKVFGIVVNDETTNLGYYLFDEDNGKDRYLEDLATLWLLHFQIVSLQEASLYNMTFCGLQRERSAFEKEQLLSYVKLKMAESGKQNLFNANTVKKDIGVLLQNYSLPRKSQSNEDFSSLLIDLDLIRESAEGRGYFFNVEGKRKVVKEVFMYGLLSIKGTDNTIPFEIIQDKVGMAFCMSNIETIDMLKSLAEQYAEYMSYNDVAGIRQVQFMKSLDSFQVLDDYYEANI